MDHLYGFLLRAILSGVIAVIIARTFRPNGGPLTVVGLSIFLLGMAYLLDYFRKHNTGK